MTVSLFDVAEITDPELRRSEAICLGLEDTLSQLDEHPSVIIAAVATMLACLLIQCPDKVRAAMADSVVDDIRRQVRESLD